MKLKEYIKEIEVFVSNNPEALEHGLYSWTGGDADGFYKLTPCPNLALLKKSGSETSDGISFEISFDEHFVLMGFSPERHLTKSGLDKLRRKDDNN